MNVHSVSLKGLRPQNEDEEDIILNMNDTNKDLQCINFFGIYDGHGGKQVSKFIKDNISKYFMNKKVVYPLSRNYVNSVYDHIQNMLKKENFAYHCGSTAIVVVNFKHNNDNYLNVINLGDCRCILARDNFAMPLTKDHKPNWPEERRRIEKLGGNITFDGYDWRIKDLSVSRAFGDIDATPYVSNRPDLFRYKLDSSDKFLIICCDGLIETMDSQEIVNFILLNFYDSTLTKRINKEVNAAKKLAEYAIKKGSQDNVSVIVVFFD